MKTRILYFAALATVIAACQKEEIATPSQEIEEPAPVVKMVTETVSGTTGVSTKASIGNTNGAFSWTEGDDIAVHVSNGASHKFVFTSDSGASGASEAGASASFTVAYEEGYSRDAFAVFPSNLVVADAADYGQEGVDLNVTLPASYTLAQISGEATPCPMIAANAPGDGWSFYQLCGLLRLTVNDIPADAIGIAIQFPGKKVNGSFSVAAPVIPGASAIATGVPAAGEDAVTVTFDAGTTTATVNIPLPVGTYDEVRVITLGGSAYKAGTCEIKAGGYTASAAHAKKASVSLDTSFTVNNGSAITPSSSNIDNLRSLFKFSFVNGDTPVGNIRFVRIFSEGNMLQATYTEGTNKDTKGPVTLSQNTDLPDDLYVGLRFTPTAGDPAVFQVVDAGGKVYSGSINAPAAGGYANCRFYDVTVPVKLYTFTVASGKKVCFSPGDLGLEIINSESVYSFTEPFTTWGHGNTTNYNNAASAAAVTKRVWFDFYFESGLATGTVYGINGWRIPNRAGSTVDSYEWNYLVKSRAMNSGVARYYKVTIPGHQYCLLLPPDETESTEIGEDLTSGNVTNYVQYLAKGFVLLFNTNRATYLKKWSWGSSTSSYAKQGWYWAVYNNSNRYYFTWPDAGPKVDWGSNRMRNHIRYIHDVD